MSWMMPPEPQPTRVQRQMVSQISFEPPAAQADVPPPGRKLKPGANTASSIVFMTDNDMKDYATQRSAEHAELVSKHSSEFKRKDEGVLVSPGGDLDANGEVIKQSSARISPQAHPQKPRDQFTISAVLPEESGLYTSISINKRGQESHVVPQNDGFNYDEFRQRALEQSNMDRPDKSSEALSSPNYGYSKDYGFNQDGFKPTSNPPPAVRPPRESAGQSKASSYKFDSSNFY